MKGRIAILISHCDHCNEITPQNHETCGSRCQICFGQNNYSFSRSFAEATDAWLAEFYSRKYRELKEKENGGLLIFNSSTLKGI